MIALCLKTKEELDMEPGKYYLKQEGGDCGQLRLCLPQSFPSSPSYHSFHYELVGRRHQSTEAKREFVESMLGNLTEFKEELVGKTGLEMDIRNYLIQGPGCLRVIS